MTHHPISQASPPGALLLLAPGCPHCPGVLEALSAMVKTGAIGSLEAVNIAVLPERAAELGVRTVPWVRIGCFEVEGAHTQAELTRLAGQVGTAAGEADYLADRLAAGELAQAVRSVRRHPDLMRGVLALAADVERDISVRLGVGAVFEELAGKDILQHAVAALGELAASDDPRVRADAAYYLGLTHSAAAQPYLETLLNDRHDDVREIANEGLETLRRAVG